LTPIFSNNWITEAVSYCNTLAHYSDIENMVDMRLSLENVKNYIDINLIEKPLLPSGEKLDSYLEKITDNLGLFLDETIPLLPDVEQKLVAIWKECIKYSRERKETGKPSRNSPCPCGSGKKYKNEDSPPQAAEYLIRSSNTFLCTSQATGY